jgi:hypothetical protein
MNDFLKWAFDGLGTALISGLLGAIVGGTVGYKIGIKKTIRQKQKAGNNSTQTQIGEINDK